MDKRSLASHVLLGSIAVILSSTASAQTSASNSPAPTEASNVQFFIGQRVWLATWDQPFLDVQIVLPNPASPAVVVKVVVAFLLFSQAVFRTACGSLFGAVFGLRCTSSIGRQLRVEPDQRLGLAWRAAA
jgi:hypothetical protein